MNILITGGTGLIGRHFIDQYQHDYSFTVVTRNVKRAQSELPSNCEFIDDLAVLKDVSAFDAIINLAGEPIVDKRWTNAQKRVIEQSRWQTTEKLVELIHASESPPSVLISGSAIGYYGRQGDERVDEQFQDLYDEFSHRLCAKWEMLAQQAASSSTRVCVLRTGIVLAANGGALSKMLLPFKLGLGGPIASGKQYMSWIHIKDMVNAINHLLVRPLSQGAYNLTAPHPVNNKQFAKALGKALNRPALIPMPEFSLRLLMGESADLLVYGQNVVPDALVREGFHFLFPHLDEALSALLD
ncbi:TIGR01777 family oxidoreductase [Alteromonas sp. ASW11-36]|uniref:TIGR01777 family oxidoreductase n=1 Tax=Alteromonas arenosi TaxID=3055817 RepID=A0ABT7SWD9_9ALTE|nr:TIGR01777 family oxidoreductase [Alteromonas sp. ASW11-36]MDM7859877.1 TIGR01777 family oxidoreductase [Alteromonas sp. ASW11-36]